jgi:hypothetical protein
MRSRTLPTACAVVLSCALLVACSDDSPTDPGDGLQDLDWSADMQAGETLEIRGVNGSILATASPDGTARVSADKNGNNSPESSVTFEVVSHAGGVTICAMYPDVSGEPDNECVPGGGQMTVRDNDVVVTFAVQVPEGVRLSEWTVNGNVRATAVQSEVIGFTVNGDAQISTTDLAEAVTVNGNVEVTIGDESPDRALAFTTVNGNVTLRVPAGIDASVNAATVNGTMNSDFLLANPAPGQWTGTLGDGGSNLALSTVNGNLELRSVP